ncbi:MAG: hypothetical protein C3F07_19225 [Anaerolineales bacterium]|nr:MAG: hypothetical protein C3F07_19225 [Anaerolineales bacterium]
MKQTLKVSLVIGLPVRRDGFACNDEGQREKPLGSRMLVVNAFPLAMLRGYPAGTMCFAIRAHTGNHGKARHNTHHYEFL